MGIRNLFPGVRGLPGEGTREGTSVPELTDVEGGPACCQLHRIAAQRWS